jgi:hypothetical protein
MVHEKKQDAQTTRTTHVRKERRRALNTSEARPKVLDAQFKKNKWLIKKLDRYYRSKSDQDLQWMRAELQRRQGMLGNIPLLASTTPVIFLIFGAQVNKYFPHDKFHWLIVAVLSVVVIVWAINHHFRVKGRVNLEMYLVDQILKERSQRKPEPVQ